MMDAGELGEYIDEHFTSELFRLETLDHYDVSQERDEFAKFLAGDVVEPDDAWPSVIRREVARGLHTYRVHVLRRPLTDYLRYELWGYQANAAAGEHIRILDSTDIPRPSDVPDEDFWLIGEEHGIRMEYDIDGMFVGAHVAGAEDVAMYRRGRDAAWHAGIGLDEYIGVHARELAVYREA